MKKNSCQFASSLQVTEPSFLLKQLPFSTDWPQNRVNKVNPVLKIMQVFSRNKVKGCSKLSK